jgi:hypothetical protein
MESFSYLSVLLSIILGLALTQLLQGLRGIALHRSRVRAWWPVLAWAATLTLIFVQTWWAMFGLRRHTDWAFVQFFTVILHTVLLYMLAALLLPDFSGTEVIDLRTHYFQQRRLFMAVLVGAGVASLMKDLVMDGHLPGRANLIFHAAFIAMGLTAMATSREWYHKLLAFAGVIGFTGYVVLLFSALNQI